MRGWDGVEWGFINVPSSMLAEGLEARWPRYVYFLARWREHECGLGFPDPRSGNLKRTMVVK